MKLAIIGTGISGMGAAHILSETHDITVYEKNNYAGGHSRTVDIETPDGAVSVDTGFIVFNKRNYPHLVSLFESLNVPVAPSDMSFGVSIDDGWLEYGTASLQHSFAQRRNVIRPQYLGMLSDILKFHKLALANEEMAPDVTLGEWINKLKFGAWFRDYFLLPMGGAIWSMPVEQMMNYPASTFIRFFDNHGLLGMHDAPQWYTVLGGSRAYVERLTAKFSSRIKLNCGALQVIRHEGGVDVIDEHHVRTTYDKVVFACHSDQALQLLATPTREEQQILGAIRYQDNQMVLHRDLRLMPKRRRAWSSWVYLSQSKNDQTDDMCVSYWMNNLQPLGIASPVIVTLNPPFMPDDTLIYDQATLAHPVFDKDAIIAQSRIADIQGTDRIWYCGAWQRYGFHEDGLLSAVTMAEKLVADEKVSPTSVAASLASSEFVPAEGEPVSCL